MIAVSNNCKYTKLASICTRISSGGTPSRSDPQNFSPHGHIWIKSKELTDGPIYESEERISDQGLATSSAKYFPQDTVLMAMYGATVGKLGILKQPATTNQAICGLEIDNTKADYRYVYYALLQTREALTEKAFGAAQQNLNQDLIRNFEIPLPPLPTQRKIADILSAYDDLIENNTRRIAILEEVAQRLYQEWFVHFRYPGHENVPLVDNELGPIPEGWEVQTLHSACSQIASGGTPSRQIAEYWDPPSIPWFKTKELNDGFLFESEESISDFGLRKSRAC
jgi:type I restriction enzyme S subunit